MNVDIKRNHNAESEGTINLEKEYQDDMKEIADRGIGSELVEGDLLAGYKDEKGVIHKTYTLRDMTGEDEEVISRSDIKSNGAKMISTLLSRCVTSIGTLTKKSVGVQAWKKIFEDMLVGDRDMMLLNLRKNSIGEDIEVTHTCTNPNCKAKLKTLISVDEIEVNPFDGLWEIPFDLPKGYVDAKGNVHKTGKMRRPNGLDGEILTPVAKNNIAKANSLLLSRLCQFDDGAYIDQAIMAKLCVKDRQYLNNLLAEHPFGPDLTFTVMCDQCGEEFRATLNQANFI